MSVNRHSQIDRLADVVREACELTPPIDVAKAVKRLNGKIKTVKNPENFEAKIEKLGKDAFIITIAEGSYQPREKFSIAHELGHLFLHMGYLVNNEKWNKVGPYTDAVHYRYGQNVQENEANEFAGAFLMPAADFRKIALQNYKDKGYYITPIADYFGVSPEAARIRGRWLRMFSWE